MVAPTQATTNVKNSTWTIIALLLFVSLFGVWAAFTGEEVEHGDRPLVDLPRDTPVGSSNALVTSALIKKEKPNVEHDEEPNPFDDDALREQFRQVSDTYAENIKYPITSQPIRNPEEVREYKEFEQAEVDLPFPDGNDDDNPVRIAASTNTFQYFEGDVQTCWLRAQLNLHGHL